MSFTHNTFVIHMVILDQNLETGTNQQTNDVLVPSFFVLTNDKAILEYHQ